MDKEELGALLQKLKTNREKVPRELLETKYRGPYGRLKGQIGQGLREEAARLPAWGVPVQPAPPWVMETVAGLFNESLKASGLMPQIRGAVYQRYDAAEALALARKVNKGFLQSLAGYVGGRVCLVLEAGHLEKEPKIYNYYLGMFWDREAGNWRAPRADEVAPDAGQLWQKEKK